MDTFVLDDDLGFRLKPNNIIQFDQPEYKTKIITDNFGFIGNKTYNDYLNKNKKIVILGDSFAMGVGVNWNETFSYLLEEKNPNNLSVFNLAVGGYGTIQNKILLEEKIDFINPDIVILATYIGNDISDDYTYIHNHKYYLTEKLDLTRNKNYQDRKKYTDLYIYKYIQRIKKGNPYVLGKNKTKGVPFKYQQYYKEYSPFMEENLKRLLNQYESINKMLVAKNASFIILVIPDKIQLSRELKDFVLIAYNLEFNQLDFYKINRAIYNWSSIKNVPLIDMTYEMIGNPNKYYYDLDHHWNAEGHRIASEKIYTTIQKNHGDLLE